MYFKQTRNESIYFEMFKQSNIHLFCRKCNDISNHNLCTMNKKLLMTIKK